MLTALLVVGGLVLLAAGGEFLVRGSIALARHFGVSPAVIGLTLVAFGTSVPELVVSLQAAWSGHADIVLGNIVGSNIANILLIIGAAALVKAVVLDRSAIRIDGLSLLFGTGMFIALCFVGWFSVPLGAAMLLTLALYGLWSFTRARQPNGENEPENASEPALDGKHFWGPFFLTVAGIIGVLLGAHFLVDGAVSVARAAGLSEAVIGLTLVAFGTSLPELAASLVAAWRGHSDLAVGNVMGSNLFNMFGITGATALVIDVPVPLEILDFDIWIMLIATVCFLIVILATGRIGRGTAALMLFAYIAYVAFLGSGGSVIGPA